MSAAMIGLLARALGETVSMVAAAGLGGFLFGLPLGVALFVTKPGRLKANPALNRILGLIVNAGRSVPFVILLVAIIPLTRLLTGTSIGVVAATVPLTVAAIPFVARLVEGALLDVPPSQIEAAQVLGAQPLSIIWGVLLGEARPGIVNSVTITLVTLVNYSAMAGAVGGGGLGDVGIRYGYQRFDATVMIVVVLLLIALVQAIQAAGEWLARVVDHRY
jgi:D-methionine transport system permease protein